MKKFTWALLPVAMFLSGCEKGNPSPKCSDKTTLDIVKQFLRESYLYRIPSMSVDGNSSAFPPDDFIIEGIVSLEPINMNRGYACTASAKGILTMDENMNKLKRGTQLARKLQEGWKPESPENRISYKVFMTDDNQVRVSMPR